MMANGSRKISPYTPSIYLPQSWGRYRQYPHTVRTPIPGANVMAGPMIWGDQRLNIDGGGVFRSSSVSRVPLLGLGQAAMTLHPSATAVAPTWAPPPVNMYAVLIYGTLAATIAVGAGAGYWYRGRRLRANRRRRSRR